MGQACASGPAMGDLIRQSIISAVQTYQVTEQRHVMQRFFHRRVAQRVPLRHEGDVQQRLNEERRCERFLDALNPGLHCFIASMVSGKQFDLKLGPRLFPCASLVGAI